MRRTRPDGRVVVFSACRSCRNQTSAGYIVIVTRPDGRTAYQLTAEGARVARQLAMSGEDAQDALLAGLLDALG